jgi:hypothetical protein
MALAPGASGTATVSVTAPGNTAAGSYDVDGGTKADAAHAAVVASGKFWVDPLPPGAPASVTATAKANRVTVSWTASTDAGGSGIDRYEVRRGATTLGTATSTSYSDSPGSGTWTYSISAVDRAGNVSPATASNPVKVGRK